MKKALLVLAAALALVAFAVIPSGASGGTTTCTTTITGTVTGNLTAGPGCVLDGATVNGNVTVGNGGSLTTSATYGALTLITGSVSVSGRGSLATNYQTTIGGNVSIQNTNRSVSICGTTIGGNLSVQNNTGPTSIGRFCASNTVSGNLTIRDNETNPAINISNTSVGGDLTCRENEPRPIVGTGIFVTGKTTGQCKRSTTIPCPVSGCTLTGFTNGNTTVTVFVPGGGIAGNLTVTLSPPPQTDSCLFNGEGGPFGSIITVVPPGGYGAGNPILVTITYAGGEGNLFVNGVCKKNTGETSFHSIFECFSECSPPFFTRGDNNAVIVSMTSTDPSFGGHG